MVHSRQVTISSFHRDAWVEIDLSAVEYNVKVIRSWLAGNEHPTRLMGVVKSDAYGHGAPAVGELLSACGAEWLGVASVDEGCQLRSAGIKAKVLILSPTPSWAIENALEDDLELTIASSLEVRDISKIAARHNRKACVHLKVDSGMHRLGAHPESVPELVSEISKFKNLELVSVFSHLCQAGDEPTSIMQLNTFSSVIDALSKFEKNHFYHLASSEATRLFPQTHLEMVRVGLYLYGLEAKGRSDVLRPAMSVRARINHINTVAAGNSVGYNLTWTADRESRLASIPIGYADGVDRRLSNRMRGLLHGREVRQVGLISMDQMLFDITDVPESQQGDVITLIGSEMDLLKNKKRTAGEDGCLYLASWAEMLDTITYELACRLRARLPRIYTRHHQDESSPASLPKTAKQAQSYSRES